MREYKLIDTLSGRKEHTLTLFYQPYISHELTVCATPNSHQMARMAASQTGYCPCDFLCKCGLKCTHGPWSLFVCNLQTELIILQIIAIRQDNRPQACTGSKGKGVCFPLIAGKAFKTGECNNVNVVQSLVFANPDDECIGFEYVDPVSTNQLCAHTLFEAIPTARWGTALPGNSSISIRITGQYQELQLQLSASGALRISVNSKCVIINILNKFACIQPSSQFA
jgi:hypothetical protein